MTCWTYRPGSSLKLTACLLLMRCSLRERLSAEEVARVAAEACAAKSAAAAEAAADALAVKEQQMAAWRDLEQASKATASQQMQLTQVGLHVKRWLTHRVYGYSL